MMASEEILSTTKYCCLACNKQYTRKSSLDKHKILCDFKIKTKREIQCIGHQFGTL